MLITGHLANLHSIKTVDESPDGDGEGAERF